MIHRRDTPLSTVAHGLIYNRFLEFPKSPSVTADNALSLTRFNRRLALLQLKEGCFHFR